MPDLTGYGGYGRPVLGGRDSSAERRAMIARLLADQAQRPVGNALGAAAQGAEKIVQALMMRRMLDEDRTRETGAAATMANAGRLMTGQPAETQSFGDGTVINWDKRDPNPRQAIVNLLSNPQTAGYGMQQQGRLQEQEEWKSRFGEQERAADERQQQLLTHQGEQAKQQRTLTETLARQQREATLAAARLRASDDGEVGAKLRAAGIQPGTPEARAFLLQLAGKTGDVPKEDFRDAMLAERLGVPVSDINPYKGLSDKGRDQMRNATDRTFQKWSDEATEADTSNRAMIKQIERFEALNTLAPTGGWLDNMSGTRMMKGVLDPNYKEMTAITAELAPKMRMPGTGATSDYDAAQFERATLGVDKPKEVNQSIATARRLAAQNGLDFNQFRRDFYAANGHLQGAEEAWKGYVEANPIFDPAKKGEYVLNPSREPYQKWFNAKRGSAPAAVAPAESGEEPKTPKRLRFNPDTGEIE